MVRGRPLACGPRQRPPQAQLHLPQRRQPRQRRHRRLAHLALNAARLRRSGAAGCGGGACRSAGGACAHLLRPCSAPKPLCVPTAARLALTPIHTHTLHPTHPPTCTLRCSRLKAEQSAAVSAWASFRWQLASSSRSSCTPDGRLSQDAGAESKAGVCGAPASPCAAGARLRLQQAGALPACAAWRAAPPPARPR